MYPEVRAEMARKNMTLDKMVATGEIGCTASTLSLKLNGRYPLTFKEAVAIKNVLESTLALEVLFRED